MATIWLCFNSVSQFVGVGTTAPGAGLDVTKPGGDTPTANFRGTGYMSHFNHGFSEDTYIRGGRVGLHVILNDITGGYVGIGNSTPAYLLDVSNRIRLRSGGTLSNTAGIWLNKTNNTILQSFFGIENDRYAGIYGSGSGWSFGMNTDNGDVKIMGRLGIGTTNPNAPLTFPAFLGKKITLYPGGSGDVGLATVNVHAVSVGCAFCSYSSLILDVEANGALQRFSTDIPNGSSADFSGTVLIQLAPGTYTLRVLADSFGPDVYIEGGSYVNKSRMILLMIPE